MKKVVNINEVLTPQHHYARIEGAKPYYGNEIFVSPDHDQCRNKAFFVFL